MSYFPIIVAFGGVGKACEQIRFLQTMGAKSRRLPAPEDPQGMQDSSPATNRRHLPRQRRHHRMVERRRGYYMIRGKRLPNDKVFAAILCVIVLSLGLNITAFFKNYIIKCLFKGDYYEINEALPWCHSYYWTARGNAKINHPIQILKIDDVSIVLRHVPTNHTGLYVVKDKGYFSRPA